MNRVFGFAEHFRYGDLVCGAQMRSALFALWSGGGEPGQKSPAQLGYGTQSVTVFVEEVDEHYRRPKSAGAKIVEEPHQTSMANTSSGWKTSTVVAGCLRVMPGM